MLSINIELSGLLSVSSFVSSADVKLCRVCYLAWPVVGSVFTVHRHSLLSVTQKDLAPHWDTADAEIKVLCIESQ